MTNTLLVLTNIGIILLAGIVIVILSKKLRLPEHLFLIIFGILISHLSYQGQRIIEFSPIFLTSISILALAMIVFDAASRLKIKEFDTFSLKALKLSIIFITFCVILLTISLYFLFNITDIMLAILFATVMIGTSPDVILPILKEAKSKVFELLEIESILNTPLTVLLPFLLIDIIMGIKKASFDELLLYVPPFLQQFIVGIGTGVIVGLIVSKIMSKKYSPTLSPLATITSALLTYVLAENLGGNGVLAVTTLGLVFGNFYIQHKKKLQEFSATFSEFLEIFVFVLIGLVIKIPLTYQFLTSSLILFLIYIFIRFITIQLTFIKSSYTQKEKLFMTLNIPKGIAVAVVAFTLATLTIPGLKIILDLILMFIIYSIILSTIATRFSKYFTKIEILKKERFKA